MILDAVMGHLFRFDDGLPAQRLVWDRTPAEDVGRPGVRDSSGILIRVGRIEDVAEPPSGGWVGAGSG